MTTYHQFHLNLLKLGYNNLIRQLPDEATEGYIPELEGLLELYRDAITQFEAQDPQAYQTGQTLMTRLVSMLPQYMPLMARDLLWMFGGDCIHYLSDQEIEQYQRLDEARFEAENQGEYDYLQLRNALISEPGSSTTQH